MVSVLLSALVERCFDSRMRDLSCLNFSYFHEFEGVIIKGALQQGDLFYSLSALFALYCGLLPFKSIGTRSKKNTNNNKMM